jgi:enoyl-[acyl-carrier protein] reductase/trans-2-enoyl-CoA reductase (NAD+)
MQLETFRKLPLGGVDRRAMMARIAADGPAAADRALAADRSAITPTHAHIAADTAVVLLGGSNGITRALALQLLFGEGAAVVAIHYDSPRMQIGPQHIRAMHEAAQAEGQQSLCFNADATKDETIAEVVAALRDRFRAVHLLNGIAAGSPKRHARYGTTQVVDLDVVFDPLLQIPDFSRPEHIRRIGLVEVEVASDKEVERTLQLMGHSTERWTDALAEAKLLARGESVIGFCDYDAPADDPVYRKGPLADAKVMQRQRLQAIRQRHGVIAVRVCYPAMPTTALSAIPGGLLMYALTAQILKERGQYRTLADLARDSMALWATPPPQELRLDQAYQQCLDEFRSRRATLGPADLARAFRLLFESPS